MRRTGLFRLRFPSHQLPSAADRVLQDDLSRRGIGVVDDVSSGVALFLVYRHHALQNGYACRRS